MIAGLRDWIYWIERTHFALEREIFSLFPPTVIDLSIVPVERYLDDNQKT